MENLYNYYYEQLPKTTNPGRLLTEFFVRLFDLEQKPTRSDFILINRLVKIFGRFIVFFSLVDVAGRENITATSVRDVYGYLFTVCKSKITQQIEPDAYASQVNLEPIVNKYIKQIEENKKEQ